MIIESSSLRKHLKKMPQKQRQDLYGDAVIAGALAEEIPLVTPDDCDALSFDVLPTQLRMWLQNEVSKEKSKHNLAFGWRVVGSFDSEKFWNSVNYISVEHQALNLSFFLQDGKLKQKVNKQGQGYTKKVIDLSHLSSLEQEQSLAAISEEDAKAPFDLEKGPLWRVHEIKLDQKCRLILFTIHHIICDGPSLSMLFSNLWRSYQSLGMSTADQPDFLPYSEWYNCTRLSESEEKDQSYWGEILAELPSRLTWPAPVKSGPGSGESLVFTVPGNVKKDLERLSKQHKCSVYSVLLAIHYLCLVKITGQEDIVIGVPISKRLHPEAEDIIGLFIDTGILRINSLLETDFLSLLSCAQDQVVKSLKHKNASFLDIAQKKLSKNGTVASSLFQNIFAMGGGLNIDLPDGLSFARYHRYHGTASTDFSITTSEDFADGSLDFFVSYDPGEVGGEQAQLYASYYISLCKEVVSSPKKSCKTLVSNINIEDSALQFLEKNAAYMPNKIAVVDSTNELSFSVLYRSANRIAQELVKQYPKAHRVGIAMNRGVQYVLTIFAVLAAGKTYVPLDLRQPRQFLKNIAKDARCDFLIVDQAGKEKRISDSFILEDFEDLLLNSRAHSDSQPIVPLLENKNAYILFTSGSMGKRRGVVMGNAALIKYIKALSSRLCLKPQDNFLHTAAFSFSSSIRQLFSPIEAGIKLVILNDVSLGDPSAITEAIERHEISILDTVPSVYASLAHAFQNNALSDEAQSTIRLCISSGEPLSSVVATSVRNFIAPNTSLVVIYGQTETLGVSSHRLEPKDSIPAGRVSSGQPFDGITVKFAPLDSMEVHNGDLLINNKDTDNELVVETSILMEGYLDPETGQIRKQNKQDRNIYYTGDVGHLNEQNLLIVTGRRDLQIKISGQRIDLSEVEAAIKEVVDTKYVVALASEKKLGEHQLIAFLIKDELGNFSEEEILFKLKETTASYLVPARVHVVSELPKTVSGKVDFSALRKLDTQSLESRSDQGRSDCIKDAVLTFCLSQASRILKRPANANDSFYKLGGDSLSAGRLAASIAIGQNPIKGVDVSYLKTFSNIASRVRADLKKELQRWESEKISSSPRGTILKVSISPFLLSKNNKKSVEWLLKILTTIKENFASGIPSTTLIISEDLDNFKSASTLLKVDNKISNDGDALGQLRDLVSNAGFRNLSRLSNLDPSIQSFLKKIRLERSTSINDVDLPFQATDSKTNYKRLKDMSVKAETDNPTVSGRSNLVPLTSMQQEILAGCLLANNSKKTLYHVQTRFVFEAAWDPKSLQEAWENLVDEIEVLRASVVLEEPQNAVIKVDDFSSCVLGCEDWSSLSPEAQLKRRSLVASADLRQPFELSEGSLIRLHLARIEEDKVEALLSHHHIVMDGFSRNIFVELFIKTYRALLLNHEVKPCNFLSLSSFVSDYLNKMPSGESDLFWKDHLHFVSECAPALKSHENSELIRVSDKYYEKTITLNPEDLGCLRELAIDLGVSLASLCVSCWGIVLSRISNSENVKSGIILNGNDLGHDKQSAPLYCLISSAPFGLSVKPEASVQDWVKEVHELSVSIQRNSNTDLQKICSEEGIKRNDIEFDSVVVFTENFSHLLDGEVTSLELVNDETNVPIEIQFTVEDNLSVHIKTPLKKYVQAVDQIEKQLSVLLNEPQVWINKTIQEAPSVSTEERNNLLVECNNTDYDVPLSKTFSDLLYGKKEELAEAAIIDEEGTIFLEELLCLSNKISSILRQKGIKENDRLLVLTDRNRWFSASMLAAFQLGASYTPLDPENVDERSIAVVDQCQAKFLLTDSAMLELSEKLKGKSNASIEVVNVENACDQLMQDSFAPYAAQPDDVAYTIFTSGSTGVPKGAMVEHKGMLNHLYAKVIDLSLSKKDIVAQTASPVFDVSVWQFLVALLVGGKTRVYPANVSKDPLQLLRKSAADGVTVLEVVPSFLRVMMDAVETMPINERPQLPSLRWLMATGEALTSDVCRRWLSLYPDTKIINAYGPTECSDDVAHYVVDPDKLDEGNSPVPIGFPIINMKLVVLDQSMRPVPQGEVGELFVAGVGVGKGYLGDKGKTDLSFIPNPIPELKEDRLYRTGDVVRQIPDGAFLFLGRKDSQIKINGHRIELGEIESAFERSNLVGQAICFYDADKKSGHLSMVIKPNQVFSEEKLKKEMAEWAKRVLPAHMRPHNYFCVDQVPVLPSGKADRNTLSALVIQGNASLENNPLVTEGEVASVWKKVLGDIEINMNDDFFALGGNSLALISLQTEIRKAFDVEVSIQSLFEEPTLEACCSQVDCALKKSASN